MESGGGYVLPRRGPFGRHLERCPCCREEAALLRKEARVLRRALAEMPLRPDFTRRVMEAIRGRGRRP